MQKPTSSSRISFIGGTILSAAIFSAGLIPTLSAQTSTWVEQGPGPIINGQDVGLTNPTNPVSGAVNAIATVPGDPDTIYVGTVNGGVWKTTNATAAAPTWTPLTDTALPALSIRSLAVSPLDSQIIFAGTGSSSSFSSRGDAGFGVARSTDGGIKWTVEASKTFTGAAIVSVVPTSTKGVVLAATGTQPTAALRGLFRSTDEGKIFTQVHNTANSRLPDNNVSSVVADPTSIHRYYLAIPDTYTSFGFTGAGVWKSQDAGATWVRVSAGLVVTNSSAIRLSVSAADGSVFAMVLNNNGTLGGVFRSTNQGTSWTRMDTPANTIFPGNQAGDQGAIVAHPTLEGVVFIGGDYHPTTNGCTDFGGNILRGDANEVAGSQWVDVSCDGANGTAPHADSRAFAFDSTGTSVLHGNDGGLFKLTNPDSPATRAWVSINGDIRPSEMHNIAYDPLSHVLLSGNQDTGNSYQLAAGSLTWTDISEGDGAFVAVDADQTAHPGTSIRYVGYINLKSFNRHTFGINNVQTAVSALGLNIISGPGSGQTILDFDTTTLFTNPFVLNNINPSRMLIGTSSLYESSDRGDNFTNLGSLGASVSSMSYGGTLNGTSYPDVFYVGAGSKIYHRVHLANPPTVLNLYPGSNPVSLAMDPLDYTNIYVLDSNGSVWSSIDEGATWTDHTGDLRKKVDQPQTLEIYNPPSTKKNSQDKNAHLLVGGIGDVVTLDPFHTNAKNWTKVGRGLPHAFFYDLHYNAVCDVLVVGSLGRGAWTLDAPFQGGSTAECPPVVASANTGAAASALAAAATKRHSPAAKGPKDK